MEEKPVTEKRFGECRYHMHKQHMLAYLDGLFHTQFWPHSIFINNHAVTYFLTVSLTHSILSDFLNVANVTCANVTEGCSVLDMSR